MEKSYFIYGTAVILSSLLLVGIFANDYGINQNFNNTQQIRTYHSSSVIDGSLSKEEINNIVSNDAKNALNDILTMYPELEVISSSVDIIEIKLVKDGYGVFWTMEYIVNSIVVNSEITDKETYDSYLSKDIIVGLPSSWVVKDNTYSCIVRGIESDCWKLSSTSFSCYYNQSQPSKYKLCYSTWSP